MPTALRHRHLEARILQDPERLELEESDPRRTIQWGTTKLEEHAGRFLGVADLVRKFDTDEVDGKGRKLGWALALMEMLVDPMLVAWCLLGCGSNTNAGTRSSVRASGRR